MQIAIDLGIANAIPLKTSNRATSTVGGTSFDTEVVSTAAALDALAPEWLALQRLSGPSAIFQNHAQIRIWTRHFVPAREDGFRLHVAVVRKNGVPVLILPLVISGPPHLRIARMAGDPLAQYSEVLLDPAADVRSAFAAALKTVKEAGADAIVLRRIRADSHLLALAGSKMRPGISRSTAPHAELSSYATHADYLRDLSKNMRKGLRNRRHHLEKAGDIRFEILTGGRAARDALADAIVLKRHWLIERGEVSTAFLDPATRDCLLDFAEDSETGSILMRLVVNGEPAAIRLGFEGQRTHFAYMSAYNQRFAHLAPGKMLMDFCISSLWERGLGRIDMLPPAGRHKSDWCRSETDVADYTLPLTASGRAYAELYQERLRPALRHTWQHLPTKLRSLTATLLVGI